MRTIEHRHLFNVSFSKVSKDSKILKLLLFCHHFKSSHLFSFNIKGHCWVDFSVVLKTLIMNYFGLFSLIFACAIQGKLPFLGKTFKLNVNLIFQESQVNVQMDMKELGTLAISQIASKLIGTMHMSTVKRTMGLWQSLIL